MQSTPLFNPFPGLRPFEPNEDHLFFGREKEIDELLQRLRSTRFIQVAGTSGSGKSSLVRSGLIPALQSGFMVRAGSSWRVLIFRPGEDPIGNLAAALNSSEVLGVDEDLAGTNRVLLEATLRRGDLGLVNAVRQAHLPPADNLLVVVDQFEELFRFRRSENIENSRDEAIAFFKLLHEATRQDKIPIYLVLTMRADFIGDCMDFPGLPEVINKGLYMVPRMTRDELRSAITGPVAVAGGEIEQRLVLRLLNDLGDNHDQLPLLQHALMRTWDHWVAYSPSGEGMDVTDYEAIGTLQGALSQHAEEAYQETVDAHQERIAEKIFKALTDSFSDPRGVRRPTSLQELAAICEVSVPEASEVVEKFRHAGRSFLTPSTDVPLSPETTIDLSHESLMRCWNRLVTWAEEERDSANAYVRVALAASWCEECVGGFWTDPQLELGLQWRRINRPTAAWAERYHSNFALAMDFLDRSEAEREVGREKERKRKLARQVVSYVLATLLVIVGALLFAVLKEKKSAEDNLKLAQGAIDESLSSAGRDQAREASDLPQMEQFRRELLNKARIFYLALVGKNPRSEDLRKEAALANSKLGDIDRLLVNHDAAIAEYKRAIAQLNDLAELHPRNLEYRRALAYAHNWLGETMRLRLEQNEGPASWTRADAEQEYGQALNLQQELHDRNPGNADYQQELARTYYNRGILRYDGQRLDEAETDFRKAIQLLEPLATSAAPASAGEHQNPPPALELSRVCNNIANLLRKKGKPEEAGAFFERAIAIHRELVKKDLSNREYKEELAKFYENLALLELDENHVALAEKQNHEALDLIEELASPGPSLSLNRAEAHMIRGWILQSQSRQLPEAQSETEESQHILETLKRVNASKHPEFHSMYLYFASNYAKLAEMYLQSGEILNAQHALDSLARVIPELSEEDRAKFTGQLHELQMQLRDGKVKQGR